MKRSIYPLGSFAPAHTCLPKDFCGGLRTWRLVVLHCVAKALGLLVKVEGFPFGSRRNLERHEGTAEGQIVGNAGSSL